MSQEVFFKRRTRSLETFQCISIIVWFCMGSEIHHHVEAIVFVGISLVQYFYVVFSQQINANQLKSTMESSSIPWTPTSVGPYFCQRRVNVTGAMALKSGQHKQLHVTWTNYNDLSCRLGIPQMVVIVRECPSKIPKTFRYNLPRCDLCGMSKPG